MDNGINQNTKTTFLLSTSTVESKGQSFEKPSRISGKISQLSEPQYKKRKISAQPSFSSLSQHTLLPTKRTIPLSQESQKTPGDDSYKQMDPLQFLVQVALGELNIASPTDNTNHIQFDQQEDTLEIQKSQPYVNDFLGLSPSINTDPSDENIKNIMRSELEKKDKIECIKYIARENRLFLKKENKKVNTLFSGKEKSFLTKIANYIHGSGLIMSEIESCFDLKKEL